MFLKSKKSAIYQYSFELFYKNNEQKLDNKNRLLFQIWIVFFYREENEKQKLKFIYFFLNTYDLENNESLA